MTTPADIFVLGGHQTQVEGARMFATLNIGGSTTTTVGFVVEGEETHGR